MRRRHLLTLASAWAVSGRGAVATAQGVVGLADAMPALALTVDLHSHAGRVIASRDPAIGYGRPIEAVSEPMRRGGMDLIFLAAVSDTPVTRLSVDRRRIEAFRQPLPNELRQSTIAGFGRVAAVVAHERLSVVESVEDLRLVAARGPSVLVACEGADFLEGSLERLDEAWHVHRLRSLQLTHYRVNDLGDIQTEAPVHGGLTDFGAAVVRRCQAAAVGIVVDVAHASFDTVKRVVDLATRPVVLSHTSLASTPAPRSRRISADHARAVASTGGVIGVWPSAGAFDTLDAMALGARRMADVVGVAHVGLGTDLLGFISPPVLRSYAQLPDYRVALAKVGFLPEEVAAVLGGNATRVLQAALPDR